MISEQVIQLCSAIHQHGGRAFLVGGWVRDHLRGVANSDYDLEVYGLTPAALRALLDAAGTVNAVGEAFTVYKVKLSEEIKARIPEMESTKFFSTLSTQHSALASPRSALSLDVSLPRRESKTGRGHRAFEVVGDPDMTFEEACSRRDFTINAILYDPLTAEFIDPFQGRADIENKILRVVNPVTFIEDSLRVLRAMQFVARFAFTLDSATVELCRSIDLSDLPSERIWAEVEKWLLQSHRPALGYWAARELGVTEKLWPEMHAMIGCEQEYEWHPEGDVWIHSGMVIDEARKLIDDLPYPKKLAVMLGALCHDFGKPATTKIEDGRIRSKGHEDAGIEPTKTFLDSLGLHSIDGYNVRQQVLALVADHLAPGHFYKSFLSGQIVSDGAFRRLAQRVEPDLLYRVARADCLGRTGNFKPDAMEWFIQRVNELSIAVKAPESFLKGRHLLELGVKPGREIGEIIDTIFELQLDGKITNLEEAIAAARHLLLTHSENQT